MPVKTRNVVLALTFLLLLALLALEGCSGGGGGGGIPPVGGNPTLQWDAGSWDQEAWG